MTEAVTATVGDLAVGDHVVAVGTNANGTVTAVSLTDTGATDAAGGRAFGGGNGGGGGGEGFQRPAGANGTAPQGAGGNGGGFAGGGFALGTIKSVDSSGVTVTETDGTVVTVAVSSSTRITTQETRTVADFKVGDTVRVTSQQSGDVITPTIDPDRRPHRRRPGRSRLRSSSGADRRRYLVSVIRRYLTKPWVALPLVAVVVVAGWSVLKPDKSASKTVTVPTEQVVAATTGTIARTVTAEGTIAYAQTSDLNFAASGTVTAVDVVAGQKVTAGQVLAVLSSPELSAAVDDDEASLASAQATLSDHQAAGASAAQLNADRTAVSSAESRLASAQAALAGAKLVAPFDGTIAQVNVTTGEQLGSNGAGGTSTSGTGSGSGRSSATLGSGTSNAQASGSQGSSSTPDVQVVTDGQYTVSLGIDDTEVANVAVGQSASLTLSTSTTTTGRGGLAGLFGGGGAGGGGAARQATTGSAATPTGLGVAPATGQVTTVSTVADASSGVAKYAVTVAFTDDTGKYHAGATVSVAITYAEVQNAVQVPSLAVTTTDGASTVKVRTASGDETRTVTTGLTSGNLVQITSGLKAGEQVVVTFAFRGGGAGGGTRGTGGTGTGGTGQLRFPGGTP